jgi:tetratricopeptide (TPR) repeat protein
MNKKPHFDLGPLPAEFAPPRKAPKLDTADLFAKGLNLHQVGRLDEAEAIYRQILQTEPYHFDSLHLLGVVFHQRGEHAQAVRQIDLALKQQQNPFAFNNRGNALLALKRYQDALESYDRALALQPDYADALCNRGAALHELQRYDEALECCDRTIALQPGYEEAHANRGNTLKELRRFEEAVASCDRALALRPNYAEAHCNRANALRELNRLDEALAAYDRALAPRPHYVKALTNRGVTLHDLKRFDEALECYGQAIAVEPDYAEVHYREAMTRLLIGDLARGWEKQEWRWKGQQLATDLRHFPQPQWRGGNEIAGKTILLHAEQGFGDTVQFCRYVPQVAMRAGSVILEVQGALVEVMGTLPGDVKIITRGDPLPAFDLHCPLLSLPLAFGTTLESIPEATPYLDVPKTAVAQWRGRLEPRRRPRIGLAWSGSATHKNDHNRSIALASFLRILDGIDGTFVSLQREVRGDDAAALTARPDIVHFGEELRTFADTAALIAELDLIIAVDTGVAHLAGALGKPVWILVSFIPDWRWLLDRDDSPWYPTARLFRQDGARRWDGVLANVHAALRAYRAASTIKN